MLPITDFDLHRSIGYWIGTVALANDRATDAAFRPHGFTLRQVQVLAWLALRKEATQVELANMLGVEPPTLVRVIDRMEQAEWISRHADPADRRKNVIRTTAEARATKGIKKADLKVATAVLEQMLANLEDGRE